jgi:acyl carrier protein
MGIDSLDALEIMLSVSDKFNIVIGEEDEDKLLNFEQLLSYIELKIR